MTRVVNVKKSKCDGLLGCLVKAKDTDFVGYIVVAQKGFGGTNYLCCAEPGDDPRCFESDEIELCRQADGMIKTADHEWLARWETHLETIEGKQAKEPGGS